VKTTRYILAVLFVNIAVLTSGAYLKWWLEPEAVLVSDSIRAAVESLTTPTTELDRETELNKIFSLPEKKTLSGGTHTFQSFNNCGPASLSMAFSYYGIALSQAELGRQLRPYQNTIGDNDDKSVTLAEMAEVASNQGFVAYHRPGGNEELVKRLISEGWPVISRTWLKPDDDIGHYRVIKGYDEVTKEFIQDDSLQGKDIRYSYSSFNRLWQAFNYEFLVLVPENKQAAAEAILGGTADPKQSWEEALELADTQLRSDSRDVYAQFNRSVALYHLGRYSESVEAFTAVSSRLPSRMLWYQIEPLLAYYQLQEYAMVLSLSEDILINENRAFSELHQLRGLIFTRQGDMVQAAEAFKAARIYNAGEHWQVNLKE